MSPVENIRLALLNATLALAEWNMLRPNYSKDGQSVEWSSHLKTLTDEVESLQKLLIMMQGPTEIRSTGV